jgi:hypothetical protein
LHGPERECPNRLRSFGCEVEPIDATLVDCVDERPRLAACSCDADQVVKEAAAMSAPLRFRFDRQKQRTR